MSFPDPRIVRANGLDMAVYEQGSGPAVVMCHGFPELAYSWRHQMPAVAAAGFRAIAPDQRGYGRTVDAATGRIPARIEDYDIVHLTDDLAAFCGDWTQAEKPKELNALMTAWLTRRFDPAS